MAKKPQPGAKEGAGGKKLAHNEPANPMETKVGSDPVTSIMMGDRTGPAVPRPKTSSAAGVQATIDADGTVRSKTGLGKQPAAEDTGDEGDDGLETEVEGDEDTPGADQTDDGEGGEADDDGGAADEDALPDYNPEDPATVEAYESRLLQNDGTPNLDAISAQWFKNAAGDPTKGKLDEGTYEFLEGRYGLSREQIKELEAGQVARQSQGANAVYERAGGKPALDAAVAWGKQGGYTDAQRKRFNAAMNSGDPEAVADAVDALMSRYGKANPGRGRRPVPPSAQGRSRPASPQRDVTEGRRAPGVKGYASNAEYSAASRAARRSGDRVAMEETRKRLRASTWFKPQ